MSKIQQKQRKYLKSRLFVRVSVRARWTRKVPKLNNSEDVKYLSLCQNRPRTSRKNKVLCSWFVAPIYNGSLRKNLSTTNVKL